MQYPNSLANHMYCNNSVYRLRWKLFGRCRNAHSCVWYSSSCSKAIGLAKSWVRRSLFNIIGVSLGVHSTCAATTSAHWLHLRNAYVQVDGARSINEKSIYNLSM